MKFDRDRFAVHLLGLMLLLSAHPVIAQEAPGHERHAPQAAASREEHRHWMTDLGGGWHLMAMGQLIPIVTAGAPGEGDSPLRETELFMTQPAAMLNLLSADERIVVRFTPNFEGLTIRDGEVTFGAWGEGFIDSRHPHTYLHELMLSWNVWDAPGGAFSLSAGRGFAAFGTDDPMARPAVKYPTNHHLSQILERWTVNAQYLFEHGVSIEAAIFDGNEPEHPGDVGNFRDFPNSWSTRMAARFGEGFGPFAAWEVSASFATVREDHHDFEDRTRLANVALRHDAVRPSGQLYGLLEASRSWPREHGGYYSVLGEVQLEREQHRPYLRVEHATRPEYERRAAAGDGFFRYHHGDHPIGATRWTIATLGYGNRLMGFPLASKPFVEIQYNAVSRHRGPPEIDPDQLFDTSNFWSLTAGIRIFLGASGPMRMGSYGVLDPMTAAHRGMHSAAPGHDHHRHGSDPGDDHDGPHGHRGHDH
jgi:hypothetical protein